MELHADHVADPCAYKLRIPYALGEAGELLEGEPFPLEESDDPILPR